MKKHLMAGALVAGLATASLAATAEPCGRPALEAQAGWAIARLVSRSEAVDAFAQGAGSGLGGEVGKLVGVRAAVSLGARVGGTIGMAGGVLGMAIGAGLGAL